MIPLDDFDTFYRDHYASAVRLGWLLSHDHGVSEDAAQNAFVKLRPRFHVVNNPSAYLRASVVNQIRDRARSLKRSDARLRLIGASETVSSLDQPSELIDVVAALPYKQRAVVVLRYWADLPEAEIASIIGVRPNTVRTLAARALATLRKALPDVD